MKRSITGYHCDAAGDWVAELACGHRQHLRHRPPFQVRPWVLVAASRDERLGSSIECPLCERAEMPDGLTPDGTSPSWDEHTMPSGLRRSHRVAAGRWGLITVQAGQLRFRAYTDPPTESLLVAGATQAIPPELGHDVWPLGTVRFSIEWFTI